MICSIVIRCYNEEKHIGKLMYGLQQQTQKELEIIVVDSGSTDGTLSIVKRFPVKIINIRSEDFSFGRSLNIGCEAATGEFIVIASAHVFPLYKNWISELLSPFQDSRIGLVYGKQRGGEATRFSEHKVFAKWFPERSISAQSHPFCNNANAAIRRKLWEKYPYNEDLTGLEDLDWANRVMVDGYGIAYSSSAAVVHLHDELFRQTFNRYQREAIAFKRIFPNEEFHLLDFSKLFISNTISDYRSAVLNGFKHKDIYEIPLFRFMQFFGTYQGFRQPGSITSQLKHKFYFPNRESDTPKNARNKPVDPQFIDYSSQGRSFRENR
jgi:glycosyltransferase involved in cell wall biosynthesis